ncbi:MAG: AfsA-related hotdog domain-containing protein [Actinomycetota bacterium]
MAHGRIVVLPGQGLGDDDVAELLALAERSAAASHFDLEALRTMPRRAGRSRSHKHRPENTLISEPRRLGETTFELDLLIDEDCELMGDHQTGQHLQGMLLLEAARQSFLAVSEAFFLPQDTRFYFVINEMTSRYNRFAFPLDARIRYTVREHEAKNALRQRFVVDIAVEQCGHDAASFVCDFTCFEDDRISRREEGLAHQALEAHLAAARAGRVSDVAAAA